MNCGLRCPLHLLFRDGHDIVNLPPGGEASSHGGCDAQRLVDANEIIVHVELP
jgi:hypothetical protein